jgi:hypothetical protein
MKRFVTAVLLSVTVAASAADFRAEAIRAHMTFLAGDLLEGRGTGTRGHLIAAEYVAAQYALAGLEPGADGRWFQDVPFVQTVADPASTVTIVRKGVAPLTLTIFDGFTSSGDPLREETLIEGEVVFAGFGVSAPDHRYDDYARLDVKGRVVAVFSGAPKSFPNAVRAHYSSTLNKVRTAASRGAVGLIILNTPEDAARTPWERSTRQSRLGTMHWTDGEGVVRGVAPSLSSTITLGLDSTRKLLGKEANAIFREMAAGKPRPRRLGVEARISLRSAHTRLTSPNVVGVLRGSDPELRDQYLVYSAHLDHVGITEPVDGDSINNGAFDNASGVSVMIEIARQFAALPEPPARSIVFLATTAEEKGLRGADYFANNPTVPFESLVANINIDMLMMAHRTRDLVAIGSETSDLGDMASQVAREMAIELTPDPFPEEVVFVRSDQYPFVQRGIPAIYVVSGYHAVDPDIDLHAVTKAWLRERYHSPKDDLQQPIDWSSALLIAEFDFRLGLAVANRSEPPRWKPDDFFGRTFGRR